MKTIRKSILVCIFISTFSITASGQSYLLENNLPAEYCNPIDFYIYVWTCVSCPLPNPAPSCASLKGPFSLSPGSSYTYILSGSEWVQRVDIHPDCQSPIGLNICTSSSTSFQQEEFSDCSPSKTSNGCYSATFQASSTQASVN